MTARLVFHCSLGLFPAIRGSFSGALPGSPHPPLEASFRWYYMITGSEVHIDIFDDRMEIYSPGGMMDGSLVQDLNTDTVPSKRRNPVIADVFSRMNYMERRGGGFKKIKADYHRAVNFREVLEPQFYSDRTNFIVTLFNLNYGVAIEKSIPPEKKASLRRKNNPSTSLKQSLKKENNPSCICSRDWASSQKLRRMFSRCINTMARSSALPVLMLPKHSM